MPPRPRRWPRPPLAASRAGHLGCCRASQARAVSSPAATPAATGKKVTLTFWGTYGNGGNKTQTDALSQTIIPAFEKANPNININYVDIPYDSLLQKLTTSAAGGAAARPGPLRHRLGAEVRGARASSRHWTAR